MRMATSLLGCVVLLHAGAAVAQGLPGNNSQQPATTLQFHRDAIEPAVPVAPANSPAAGQAPGVQQAGQPADKQQLPKTPYDETAGLRGVREVPGLERMTLLETEAMLFERMKQEALKAGDRIVFPEEPVLSKERYPGRIWAARVVQIEPTYVPHGRLLFEQKNFERGLWDLGVLTPVVEMGIFYLDVAALPYHLATRPCQQYDTSAGKCLPGDPTPFYLYPPELSFSGAVAELAVVTGMFFVFP